MATAFEDVTILDPDDLEAHALSIAASEIAREAIRPHGIETAGKLLMIADRIRRAEYDGESEFLDQLRAVVDAPVAGSGDGQYGAHYRLRAELFRLAA